MRRRASPDRLREIHALVALVDDRAVGVINGLQRAESDGGDAQSVTRS